MGILLLRKAIAAPRAASPTAAQVAAVVVSSLLVHLCYVDESGNDQLLDRRDASPVQVIAGIIIAEPKLKDVVWRFLEIKKSFKCVGPEARLTDLIKTEIKGSDLRADVRSGKRRRERYAIGVLDKVMDLLESSNVALVGQTWVKADGCGVPGHFYADAIAKIAVDFQSELAAADARGVMILDARTKVKNVPNVHGITTRKFKSGGDRLPSLVESPVFGHSDAHVALQIADIVASAMLFPMACLAYCSDVVDNVHPHPSYAKIRERYGHRLRGLEYRYTDHAGSRRGGMVVNDRRGCGRSLDLFVEPRSRNVVPLRRRRLRTRAGVPVGVESPSEESPA